MTMQISQAVAAHCFSNTVDSRISCEKCPRRLNFANRKWYESGFQVNVHAIGDLANRLTLQAFNALLPNTTSGLRNKDSRFRVEHAQILHPDDIRLAQEMGIIMSMQPTHATTDMWYALSRLGANRLANGAYAQATFARNVNTTLVLGSDFPIEPPSPLRGIYAAVTRLDPDTGISPNGPQGWYPEQKLTFEEALAGFTRDAAYSAFQEDLGGTIESGKWADWVIVEENGEVELGKGTVRETWVGGRKVFG
jgi:predicted amidohydrolase YtcJ